jgi:hypothetical protein
VTAQEFACRRVEFTNDQLVRLVHVLYDESAKELAGRGLDRARAGVSVQDVASRLVGLDDAVPTPPELDAGDLVRVGQALGRLAREGRIETANPSDRFRYFRPKMSGHG